ncbi:flagellar hook protein FlgE [Butyrivibrio proteoclasticus]|uniref:Flagellar hook protein FlgE n=1 Tax=Butyrivibrio proteoclasticus TaxID=43305 RepID=A0A1I5XKW1_9FIRM|nr:flagellar hook-basal body complex protein [Butyrivibrio proteoclasticus]SFQ32588.1 flagellar hook protein FlgE [Butyrivibrio proteoclasticus]
MMRSMWSGVAGLKTHQLEMDVIGNNIANVNTTSFKSQAAGFSDIFYQTVKPVTASADNTATTGASQIGLGSRLSSINMNITKQGSAILTDNVFDLMITGDSFFCVSPNVSEGEVNYTRDGSFTIDAQGCLVTQNNGFYVMGQMGAGNITDGTRPQAPLRLVTEATKTLPGTATTAANFRGNIDTDDTELEEGRNITLEVYGSDGNPYSLNFKLTDGDDLEDNTFAMTLSSIKNTSGQNIAFTQATNLNLVYDKHNGKLSTINGATTETVNFSVTGAGSVVGPINIDFSNTSNFAGNAMTHASSITGYKGDKKGSNTGYAKGEMNGLSISDDGSAYARYTNGQTVKIAQIVVAEFNNAMGLEKVGDNLYASSANSGNPIYMDIAKDGGYISSGVLEGSNVDLAKEFTDMITTQRGFQANSKVITTSDEMLQILKSLKR